jgi:hypothetical protein
MPPKSRTLEESQADISHTSLVDAAAPIAKKLKQKYPHHLMLHLQHQM